MSTPRNGPIALPTGRQVGTTPDIASCYNIKMIVRIVVGLISNWLALMAAERLIGGFVVIDDLFGLLTVIALFTLANSLILPAVRIILKPLLWLTLGIGPFVLNGILIYLVDIYSEGITINGFIPLILATVVIGAVNATISYVTKILK